MNADEKNSTSDEKMVLDSSRYANARCAGPIHRDCPNPPIHVCKRCGKPICTQHAREFVAGRPEKRWHEYDGYYCLYCIGSMTQEYEQNLVTEQTSEMRGDVRLCFDKRVWKEVWKCDEEDYCNLLECGSMFIEGCSY